MSLADFQAAFRQRLLAGDSNHDGKISQAELAAAREALGSGRAGKRDPSRLFKRIDADGDGALGPAEIDRISARRFARLDANHDGRVTSAERGAARGAARGKGLGMARRGGGMGEPGD
ncbi:signal transduction protein [Novosphingobium sp. G106]|uniref:signal transduction protein n=1 Tax=Novosphingobium sp. G106 TaxID=2849500 RepID=UPI0020C4E095|nr:signal transduction protein [Novosphingobium sp. G106]